jgi:hypothetical protein
VTSAELAARINLDPTAVTRLLEELGYIESDGQADITERRAWLTIEGYDLVNMAEDELLASRRTP